MDFNRTEGQTMFRDSVAAFADRHLRDGALARAHSDDYPWDVAEKMAEAGLIGITTPAEDGGVGGTLLDAVLAIQRTEERRGGKEGVSTCRCRRVPYTKTKNTKNNTK